MYLYFKSIINSRIKNVIIYFLIIDISISVFIFIRNRILKTYVIVVCILFGFLNYIFNGFMEPDIAYFEFTSPDNKTIIIEEYGILFSGWGKVYQKKDNHIVIDLKGNISTDDGYLPFSNNNYKLKWNKNSVTITYGFGSEGIEKTETIKLNKKYKTFSGYIYVIQYQVAIK